MNIACYPEGGRSIPDEYFAQSAGRLAILVFFSIGKLPGPPLASATGQEIRWDPITWMFMYESVLTR